ncbi:hypothetical protein BX600DRAFT_129888 [Xylariales sp. PMI_506]|nr:hypothetical protein BX600DRAFT_129888 [Xylariales sp. PMI_506]
MSEPADHLSSLFVGNREESEDDDDISLTSTVVSEHDESEEFEVDAILAERPNPGSPGDMQYLIKWEGYDMDQCTWESAGNLSEDLREQWRQQRGEEMRGERVPFDLRLYEEAIVDAVRRKAARHERRNLKRIQLKLPPTSPLPSDYHVASPKVHTEDENVESYSELVEDNHDTASNIPPTSTERVRIKQSIFKSLPSSPPLATTAPTTDETRPPPMSLGNLPGPSVSSSKGISQTSDSTSKWRGTARRPFTSSASGVHMDTERGKLPVVPFSTSLANKLGVKRLKATRSAAPKPLNATPIVTSTARSTISRKPRAGLKDTMMDPSRAPKLMSNMRQVNQLRKKAAELNDGAPSNPSAIPASYFVMSGSLNANPQADQPGRKPGSEDTIPNTQAAVVMPITTSVPKKIRKNLTVRFMDESALNNVAEQMEIQSPTSLSLPTDQGSSSHPPTRKLSLQTYQEKAVSQGVEKHGSFGPEGSEVVRMVFPTIPRAHSAWLSSFLLEEVFHFRAICTSEDFFTASPPIYRPESTLCHGNLEIISNPAASQTLSANLRQGSTALYVAHAKYSILVYPTQCSAWSSLKVPQEDKPGDTLRYLIFSPNPPLSLNHYGYLSDGPSTELNDINSAWLEKELMRRISTFDYDVLLPPARGNKDVFFIMFHPSEEFLFNILSLWLRACNPNCRIFHSHEAGSWKQYQKETKNGAVILHESVENTIRKLPGLWNMLKYGSHSFWKLSSSDHDTAIQLNTIGDRPGGLLYPMIPKQLDMTRLLPHGRAFHITPSFAISQPAQLCQFLEFFLSRPNAPYILVAPSNYQKYLLELVADKAQEHGSSRENSASIDKPTRQDLKDSVRAVELMNTVIETSRNGLLEEPPEHIGRISWIDEILNPDDEQSLLNYFAMWSATRLGSYRKFYVLGSSALDSKKAYRRVRVPNYVPETVNNPDRANASCSPAADDPDGISLVGQPRDPREEYVFQSRTFKNDRPEEFERWFARFHSLRGKSSFWMFFQPISWLNIAMADSFLDPRASNATYKNWFYSHMKFFKKVNTLIGLFYTIETDWEGPESETSTSRHPWIALYRPMNPHVAPNTYAKMELLIWDCAARDRWPQQPHRNHLLPMQRRLIDYVRQEAPVRFPEYTLERVWVGGWDTEGCDESPFPIDVTCNMYEAMINDRGRYVPPWERPLLAAGWKLLEGQAESATAPSAPTAGPTDLPAGQEFPRAPGDLAEPPRIIFHPPRGLGSPYSRCTNHLYTAALEARRKNPQCASFEYHYRPTPNWYLDLQDEQRASNHIYVDSWERVFDDLEIKRRP